MTTEASATPDSAITLETTIQRISDQISSDLDGETALMNIDTGNYYCLDPTSTKIWEMVEEPLTVKAICEKLVELYEVEIDQCQADVLKHLKYLHDEKLIERVEQTDAVAGD